MPSKRTLANSAAATFTSARLPAAFLAAVVVAYAVAFVALDALRFPLWGDEVHFWPTSLGFSDGLVPSVEQLRNYKELNTPLPFVIWGALEYLFGGGVFAARLFNFTISLAVVVLLTATAVRNRADGPWAAPAIGVLLSPYYLGISTHAYTDMLAIALSVLGLALHLRGRFYVGALVFALAIAARQYMLAFPAGLFLFELLRAARERGEARSLHAWLAPALAASTIGGWYLFFGDFGPVGEIARQEIVTVEAATLLPRNSLYFLACVGLYFVLPMLVLTRTAPAWSRLRSREGLAIAGALLVLFFLFPPLQNLNFQVATMGFFDRALRWLPDAARIGVFYAFALLAVVQLRGRGLALTLLLVNAALMAKAHIAWDKYALPLVIVLWYLEARAVDSGAAEQRPLPSRSHPALRDDRAPEVALPA